MTIHHNPENTTKTNEAHPSLGKALQGNREAVETLLESLKNSGLGLTHHIKSLHKTGRGSYYVHIKRDSEYNEITVKLFDTASPRAIATGFIDMGHTKDDKAMAAEELRGLVRAYLCR